VAEASRVLPDSASVPDLPPELETQDPPQPVGHARNYAWAELMKRVWAILVDTKFLCARLNLVLNSCVVTWSRRLHKGRYQAPRNIVQWRKLNPEAEDHVIDTLKRACEVVLTSTGYSMKVLIARRRQELNPKAVPYLEDAEILARWDRIVIEREAQRVFESLEKSVT
jgi:hypothetical protein